MIKDYVQSVTLLYFTVHVCVTSKNSQNLNSTSSDWFHRCDHYRNHVFEGTRVSKVLKQSVHYNYIRIRFISSTISSVFVL